MKNVLITGATSGIGYELAKLFAKEGYHLILVARNKENLKKTSEELIDIANNPSAKITIIAIDLFERSSAREIYEITQDLGIFVDILVNNAGQGEWGDFSKIDLYREIDIIELNIITLISLTKFYVRNMIRKNQGKILMLASSVSKAPSPYMAVYAASKAFILSFTEALVKELENTDVTITALQPDATDTDFFHKAKAEKSVLYREKKLSEPEMVAREGFRSLKQGKEVEVPGMQNKIQQVLNNFIPDNIIAANMQRQMKVSTKPKGRLEPAHQASLRERRTINAYNDGYNGDY
jgi:short-subunit dehydrogenase